MIWAIEDDIKTCTLGWITPFIPSSVLNKVDFYLNVLRWSGGDDGTAQETLHELTDEIPTGGRQAARLIFHLPNNNKQNRIETTHFLGILNEINRQARE